MDIKGQGFEATIVAADQTEQWLIDAANEIHEAAQARGIEIPVFAGSVATDSNVEIDAIETKIDTKSEAGIESESFAPETKESIFGQLSFAKTGYIHVLKSYNSNKSGENKAEVHKSTAIEEALGEWLTEDRLAIVNEMKEKQPGLEFTLIATPNVLATPKDIIKIAEKFGADQPYSTYVYEELYKQYSPEQLSGTDKENQSKVNFSLIPNQFTPELERTVAEQQVALDKMQADHPEIRVPSVLESITYWATLRARSNELSGSGTFDKTYIRHFDLPGQRVGGWSYVPGSCVSVVGRPDLGNSIADFVNSGRVSVG